MRIPSMDCTDPITWGRRARLLITAFALTFTLAACIHDDDDDDDDDNGGGGVVKNNTCVITHNGGAALTLSSINVTPLGNATVVETQPLTGSDDNSTVDENNAITACGNFVYAVQRASQSIARLEVNDDGTLDPLPPDVNHPGIFALQCLPDDNRLLAITPSANTLTVTAYSVAANGALAVFNVLPLDFSGGGAFRVPNLAPTAVHPTTGDLWIIGYFADLGPGMGDGSSAYIVGIDGGGSATIVDGPDDIGALDAGFEFGFGNNATQLAMAGISGNGTATWDLPMGGGLPLATDKQETFGLNFDGGITLAARAGDRVFYQGHSGNSIRIYEGNMGLQPDFEGEEATTGNLRVLKSLHNDEVLFSIGKQTGNITTFTVSPDGKTLNNVIDLNVPVVSVKSVTTVPCI